MTSHDLVLKAMVSKFFGDDQTFMVIDSPFFSQVFIGHIIGFMSCIEQFCLVIYLITELILYLHIYIHISCIFSTVIHQTQKLNC